MHKPNFTTQTSYLVQLISRCDHVNESREGITNQKSEIEIISSTGNKERSVLVNTANQICSYIHISFSLEHVTINIMKLDKSDAIL